MRVDLVVAIVVPVCSAIPMEELHLIELETLETEEPVQRPKDAVASFRALEIREVYDTPPCLVDPQSEEEDQHTFLWLPQELEEFQR